MSKSKWKNIPMPFKNSEAAGDEIESLTDNRWKSIDEDNGIYKYYDRHGDLMGEWNENTGKMKIAEREKMNNTEIKKLEGEGNVIVGFWVGSDSLEEIEGYEPAKIRLKSGNWVEVPLFGFRDTIDVEDKICEGLRLKKEITEREK